MSPDLVVHFERTAYRRFIAASSALRSLTNGRSGDSDEAACAYLRTLEARAAHEERRYRRWLRYRFAVLGSPHDWEEAKQHSMPSRANPVAPTL